MANLLSAASTVFRERGYDAATMTEIAGRASTAIGSLYRFFPTKEQLGAELVRTYAARFEEATVALAARAPELDASQLTRALLELMASLGPERAAAVAVVDSLTDNSRQREQVRRAFREQLATVLRAARPKLSRAHALEAAPVLLYLLKGSLRLTEAGEKRELRRAVEVYLAALA